MRAYFLTAVGCAEVAALFHFSVLTHRICAVFGIAGEIFVLGAAAVMMVMMLAGARTGTVMPVPAFGA